MRNADTEKLNELLLRVAEARAAVAVDLDWAEDLNTRSTDPEPVLHGDLYQSRLLDGGDSAHDHLFDVWMVTSGSEASGTRRRDVYVRGSGDPYASGMVNIKGESASYVENPALSPDFSGDWDFVLKGNGAVIPLETGTRCLIVRAWAHTAETGWPVWDWRFEVLDYDGTSLRRTGPDEYIVPIAKFEVRRVDGDDPVGFDVIVTQLFHGPIYHDEHWSYSYLPLEPGDWAGPTASRPFFDACEVTESGMFTREVVIDGRGNLQSGGPRESRIRLGQFSMGPTGPQGPSGRDGYDCTGPQGRPGPPGGPGPLRCWCAESSTLVMDVDVVPDGCSVGVYVLDVSYSEIGNTGPIPDPYTNECLVSLDNDCHCPTGPVGEEDLYIGPTFTCSCQESASASSFAIDIESYGIDELEVLESAVSYNAGVDFGVQCNTFNVPYNFVYSDGVSEYGGPCTGFCIGRATDFWYLPVYLPSLSVDLFPGFDDAVRAILSGCTGATGGSPS